MTELVIILPLFLMIAGAGISFVYMTWQGVKTQQAASLAARVQSQERVAGGQSPDKILEQNGGNNTSAQDHGLMGLMDNAAREPAIQWSRAPFDAPHGQALPRKTSPEKSVYGNIVQRVEQMFGQKERARVYVMKPEPGNLIDKVDVVRVFNPPPFFGFKFKKIFIKATGYAGEDTYMYSLPRWGKVKVKGESGSSINNRGVGGEKDFYPDLFADSHSNPLEKHKVTRH